MQSLHVPLLLALSRLDALGSVLVLLRLPWRRSAALRDDKAGSSSKAGLPDPVQRIRMEASCFAALRVGTSMVGLRLDTAGSMQKAPDT